MKIMWFLKIHWGKHSISPKQILCGNLFILFLNICYPTYSRGPEPLLIPRQMHLSWSQATQYIRNILWTLGTSASQGMWQKNEQFLFLPCHNPLWETHVLPFQIKGMKLWDKSYMISFWENSSKLQIVYLNLKYICKMFIPHSFILF